MKFILAIALLVATGQTSFSNESDLEKPVEGIDRQAFELMVGMYEIVSWNDGTQVHTPPAVSGRWSFINGKTMAIIHNRIDPKDVITKVGWGYGTFDDGKFKYAYPEFVTVKGDESQSSVKAGGPFEGEREYSVRFEGERMVMTSKSGKQVWEVSPDGMRYTDQEWGVNKVYAQRIWKRVSGKIESKDNKN